MSPATDPKDYPNIDAGDNADWIKGLPGHYDIDVDGSRIYPKIHQPGYVLDYSYKADPNRNSKSKHKATRKQAYGETTAPPEVDTLRDDTCPVCHEDTGGSPRCPICNFEQPPAQFTDPDTSVAQQMNLRQDQQQLADSQSLMDGADNSGPPTPDLMCDVCFSEFSSAEELDEAGDPHLAPAAQMKSPEQEAAEEIEEEAEMGSYGQPGTEIQTGPDDVEDDTSDEDADGANPFAKKKKAAAYTTAKSFAEQDDQAKEDDEYLEDKPLSDDQDPNADPEEVDPEDLPPEQAESTDPIENDIANTGYQEGDICPVCEEGTLIPFDPSAIDPNADPGMEDPSAEDPNAQDPAAEEVDPNIAEDEIDQDPTDPNADSAAPPNDQDYDDEESEEEQDGEDQDNPFVRKRSNKYTTAARHEGDYRVMPNPAQQQRSTLLKAIDAQAKQLRRQSSLIEALAARNDTLESQIAFIADTAGIAEPLARIGISGKQKVATILRKANPANPAQPVAEPAPEAPIATNQSAMQPMGRDDVTQLGASPVTDVSADVTTSIDQPYGELANAPVGMNRVDVTAPVAGTQEQRPPNETIIPTDVRIGNPDNPQPAFPWQMGPVGAQPPPGVGPGVTSSLDPRLASKRTMASIHLARLQIQARIAEGSDLQIAAAIDNSTMPNAEIQSSINTLTKVLAVNQANNPVAARRLVPKSASANGNSVSMRNDQAPTSSSSFHISEDEIAFE